MIGVCIVTYNQEKYIAQAIESVLMQADCGHEVALYIGEDNSTDNTGAICDEYASRSPFQSLSRSFVIKVIHNTQNLGLVGNTMNLLDIMRKDGCDYIAMLDGDDYWCDDHKLQKQMAYMQAHPEYGLVHTCGDNLWPSGLDKDKRLSEQEGDVSSIIFGYEIGNCTVIFKTELLNLIDFEEFQRQGFMSCDFIMYVIFSCYTQFGFLPDHTAVWRRGHDSVSNTNDMEKQIRYVQNDIAMWRYAAKRFPDRWHATNQETDEYLHYRSFAIAFRYGDRNRAIQESKLMGDELRKKNRRKILVAHSAILTAIYNLKQHKHNSLENYFFKLKQICSQRWAIGFVRGGLDAVMEADHLNVDWVHMPNDRWFADPFVLDVTENEILLLVEDFGYDIKKGVISLLHIDRESMEITSRKVLHELPTHLSFPAILRKDGHIYIYPESAQSRRLDLYEFHPESETLTYHQTICDDVVWDSYITEAFGEPLMFTAAKNDYQLDVYRWNRDTERYVSYMQIPSNRPNSRLGGAVFDYKGYIYYPAQDCAANYGAGIDIKRIEKREETKDMSPTFKIETIKHLSSPHLKYKLGLHTLNEYKGVVVIDVLGYRYGKIGALFSKLVKLKNRIKNAK